MKNFVEMRLKLREAKGPTITVQVKGFKGNLRKYDEERMSDGDFGLGGILGLDTDSAEYVKYGRDTVSYQFPDFNAEDAQEMFRMAKKSASDMSKYSKYTADMIKKMPDEDPSDWPGNKPIDDFYIGAWYSKMITPGKPFVYSVKIK